MNQHPEKSPRISRSWLIFAIVLVAIVATVGWRLKQNAAEEAEAAAMQEMRKTRPAVVNLVSVSKRDLADIFESVGSVEAPLSVDISPKVTGRVEAVYVDEGDKVTVGQVLARLDPTEIEAEVRKERAALSEAQYRLAQALLNEGPTDVGVGAQIRQQNAALQTANAQLKQQTESFRARVASAKALVRSAEGDVNTAKASLNSARASEKNALSRLTRTKMLADKGYAAGQDLEDAETQLEVQKSMVAERQAELDAAESDLISAREEASVVEAQAEADLEAAKASVEQAKAASDVAKANVVQKPAFRKAIAALEASVASAEASVRSAEARRADTVLRSPLNGVVTARNLDPGSVGTPTTKIVSVQAIRTVWLNTPVPETISVKAFVGQEASVVLDAFPGRTFQGKVAMVNAAADNLSRKITMRVALDNSNGEIKPGMFGRVRLDLGTVRNATVVPREALKQSDAGSKIVVVDSSMTAREKSVQIGSLTPEWVQVLEGVDIGDRVVVLAGRPVKDGQKVVDANAPKRAAADGKGGKTQ